MNVGTKILYSYKMKNDIFEAEIIQILGDFIKLKVFTQNGYWLFKWEEFKKIDIKKEF
jgi:hypothetical protein